MTEQTKAGSCKLAEKKAPRKLSFRANAKNERQSLFISLAL
jgi:hypothetical protein